MDRVAYVEHFASTAKGFEASSFINAFVRCLSPGDATSLLLNTAGTHCPIRTAAIKKVRSDISSGRLADPAPLVEALMSQIESGDARRRESSAYCLLEIARACETSLQRRIQAYLGASRYVRLRRRSYKLYDAECEASRVILENAWRTHKDSEAAWAIVKTFPITFLLAEKNVLLSSMTEGWQLSRLYLRIADMKPEAVEELRALDPVSYMYVAAKLGVQPPPEIIDHILDICLGDERFGLLLWSLGELGLWDVLVSTGNRIETIEAARRSHFLDRFS